MIDEYLHLVETVPVFRLRLRVGLEHLPRILDDLEALVAEKSTAG
jgi:hypothetical protein